MKATAAIAVDQRSEIGKLRRELEVAREALEKLWRSVTLLGEQLPAQVQPQWTWSSIGDSIRAARTVLDRRASLRSLEGGPLTHKQVENWLNEAVQRDGADACRIVALATEWLKVNR